MLTNNLILLRNLKNVSQQEVADVLEISRQAYSKWEKGETVPDINKCKMLAEYYNVTLDDLVNFNQKQDGLIIPPGPKGKHLYGTVVMGERGQIVIPKEARDLFGLVTGSKIVVLGDEQEGIALIKTEEFEKRIQGSLYHGNRRR